MVTIPVQAAAAHSLWPPDDSEESILGTDRHQMTIINVRVGINEAARATAGRGQPVSWQALSQLMITGFARPDGSRYTTYPDVFVYRRSIAQDRGSYSIALDGPPSLIVEVASESTYEWDLDLVSGKGWSYAHAGVREYVVLDPTGLYLPELIRSWRLEGGMYQPWLPDPQGRWQSREIGVSLGVEEGLATVYTGTGQRQLREGEITEALARKEAENAELRRKLEERDRPSLGDA